MPNLKRRHACYVPGLPWHVSQGVEAGCPFPRDAWGNLTLKGVLPVARGASLAITAHRYAVASAELLTPSMNGVSVADRARLTHHHVVALPPGVRAKPDGIDNGPPTLELSQSGEPLRADFLALVEVYRTSGFYGFSVQGAPHMARILEENFSVHDVDYVADCPPVVKRAVTVYPYSICFHLVLLAGASGVFPPLFPEARAEGISLPLDQNNIRLSYNTQPKKDASFIFFAAMSIKKGAADRPQPLCRPGIVCG